MLKKIFYGLILILFLAGAARSEERAKWEAYKSTHFIIYYQKAPENFVYKVSSAAEEYYDKIAEALGFTRYNFWLWDNRAKIYIYDNAKDYQEGTKQPAWSAGIANPQEKTIYSFAFSQEFFDHILPHEMGHIIFRELVGFNNPAVPLWLEEGIASFQEKKKSTSVDFIIAQAVKNNSLLDITKIDSYNLKNMPQDKAMLFYAQSISMMNYLIREYGKENFNLFCQKLRDKRSLQQALAIIYPFSKAEELQEEWKQHLKK